MQEQGLMCARCCENEIIINRKFLVCKESYGNKDTLDPVFGENLLSAFLNYAWYNQKAQDRKFSLHISSGRQLNVETCRDDEKKGWGDVQLKKGRH